VTLLTKHADLTTTWGPDVRALLGGYNASRVMYADDPHPGVAAVVANGTTNDAATVQAQLDYVKATWGSGRLVLPPNRALKMNAGITIPAKVQLVMDPTTTLDFSALSTTAGVAITISDSDFTPLVGGLVVGPSGDPRSTPTNTADVSIGLKVTGVRLNLVDVQVKSFGRGIRGSHSDTWSISYLGGAIYQCYYNIWWDNNADAATNAGESITFERTTIYNAVKGMRITGNGVSAFFEKCRIDYLLNRFGEIEDAWVYFTDCHIEVGATQISYLFDVDKNAHVFFTGCRILMGAGSPNITHFVFNPAKAPWNLTFGGARFTTSTVFYVNPSGANSEQNSEYMLEFPANTTTLTFHTPYPVRWCPVSADFVSSDFRTLTANDTVRVGWSDSASGNVTLTASASSTSIRFVRVLFH